MKKDIDFLSWNNDKKEFMVSWYEDKNLTSGRERLVQSIIKRLLTLKGSNSFDPGFGENFYNLYGVIDLSKAQQVKESFPVLIKNVEEDIKIAQINIGLDRIEDSESLKSIDLVNIEFEEKTGSWLIEIRVVTRDLVANNILI